MNSSNTNNGQSNNGKSSRLDGINRDLGLYFLELARLRSSAAPTEMEEDEEEAPKELNTINSSGGFLVVAPDKLSVKYTTVNLHGHDVGVVQANKPAPVKRLLYYFEIYVKDAGAKGQIAIGFTNEGFKMRRQPGWEVNSCGYHGDDGLLYRGQGKGDAFGPTYTTGDTVAHYVDASKNGVLVGTVCKEKEMKGRLFPTIAVHSQNEDCILGPVVHFLLIHQYTRYFLDLEYEAQERLKRQMTIEKISLPPNISYGLVRSYLLHYGYEDTLNSFDLASKSTIPPVYIAQENGFDEQDIGYALNQRKILRQLISNGEIDAAISKLRDWYPQIVQARIEMFKLGQDDKSATCFLLHCQKFIELVRVGALEEAVKYGRIELAKFFRLAGFDDLVQDCVALLAYEHPQESCVGYLLEESQRDLVADTINAMILSTNPNTQDMEGCLQSYLERLLRQLTACCLERRSANGEQGEAFLLRRVLNS
ncbi:ran-binding protein 10 [Gossypium australe]|uniref:Ran-binding protein 10 n=1 Tax=Gossypium australe TaxID=47621 RepID=A0A5B6UF03_9ROSI|nr:ran-binding protein 10 [Gossypium australe]